MTELRQRRNTSQSKPEGSKELTSFLPEKPKEESNSNLDDADGYLILPLAERWILSRLDVGPFILCYTFLIYLDHYEGILEQTLVERAFKFAFPVVLLAHIALFLLQQWNVSWRAAVGYRKLSLASKTKNWTHCLVEAPHVDKHHSANDVEIVSVNKQENDIAVISFQDMIFRSSPAEKDIDTTLWRKEQEAQMAQVSSQSSFHRLRYPIDMPLSFYKQWKGHESLKALVQAQRLYGSNTTPIRLPPFLEMLQEQLVAPFFLFQVLCVLLWSLDEYWYYAMFTFFALVMFESTVAFNRLKSLQRLRSHTLNSHQKILWVYRPSFPPPSKQWQQIYAHEIVPGDIISCKEATLGKGKRLQQKKGNHLNRIPADILILSGDAVVDESLLTGESVPQLKTALDDTSDRSLDLQEHKQSICFGGTNLLVSHPGESTGLTSQIPHAPDLGVIGMVLRSGFETAQGSLLRTMAHTQKSVDGIHTRDTYVFILLLLLCAVASASFVWQEGWADESRNKFRLVLHVIIIITSVVPPELPMELSLAVTNSVADLMKRCQVYCTEIFRIPIAGQVDFCCFDKTGTLTSDEMQLKGVKLVTADACFGDLAKPESSLPMETTMVMAACHSLALSGSVNGHANIIGDPLEKAIMQHTGYTLISNHLLRKEDFTTGEAHNISILHRFGFTSRLKRMTVLAQESSSKDIWVLTKGAPEVLKLLLDPKSCPPDYDETAMHHMTQGQRVLGMAYRRLARHETTSALKDSKRDKIESNLIFAGFLLLDCPVKSDSKPVIQELQRSGHQVVMITGDSVWTAAEVARQVGIIGMEGALFHLQQDSKTAAESSLGDPLESFTFNPMAPVTSTDEQKTKALPITGTNLLNLKKLVDNGHATLCISGDILQKLVLSIVRRDESTAGHSSVLKKEDKHALFHPAAQRVLKDLVPLVSIFARHAPRQKEAIIGALNLAGFKTLMCGDGTNDMASLRRAHVGISIISAPEVEAKQRDAKAKLTAAKAQRKKDKKKKKRVKAGTSSLEESLRQLQEAQEDLDQVELGDASIASPFTSRTVSIKCCKDVLQQGRCTLVTMLQIYKILGINCLVNAMVLSSLFLHGVKQGDRQLTVTGVAIAALFLFVTRGKPLSTISPLRPPQSVLCAEALTSIAVQFGIHFFCIRVATEVSLSFVDSYDPSMIPDGPFNPNTLNTCTFLMNVLATVNTFAVNYRGEPFVEPLKKNKMLLRSLQVCYGTLLICALELFPPLSDLLQLSEFPVITNETMEWNLTRSEDSASTFFILDAAKEVVTSFGFPAFICGLMAFDTILTFGSERFLLNLFQPLPN